MDPALRAIIDSLPTSTGNLTPQESRAIERQFVEAMGLNAPGRDTLRITDRTLAGPGGDLPIRIYEPADRGPTLPGVVYFHGGGFLAGNLDTEDGRCVRLAVDASCVVVSVDYRLAPEDPFPAAVDDCYAAFEWTVASADELGIDRARLGVGGGSAGGTLAAAIALMARDRSGPALAFQLLVYPAMDDRLDRAPSCQYGLPVVDRVACERVWDLYLGPEDQRGEVSPYAAPLRATDLSGLPPAYVMTAELDPLRDQGIEYASRLLAAGVSVELHQWAETFHGFDLMPSDTSFRALSEQARWVREVSQSDPAPL